MKKIIKGKVYDTETAKFLGEGGSDVGPGDFNFYNEELYVKKTGEYFLYGYGGAMSRYARQIEQSSWSGGEAITPLSYDEAREWAEGMLDADTYLEIFEPLPDDEDVVNINTLISSSTRAKLDKLRADTGKTFGQLIDEVFAKLE